MQSGIEKVIDELEFIGGFVSISPFACQEFAEYYYAAHLLKFYQLARPRSRDSLADERNLIATAIATGEIVG